MDDYYFYSPCIGCGREMIRDMHGWRLVKPEEPPRVAVRPAKPGTSA